MSKLTHTKAIHRHHKKRTTHTSYDREQFKAWSRERFSGKRVYNYRLLLNRFKGNYFTVPYYHEDGNTEAIKIEIKIDRNGRVIDCNRIGNLFTRLVGKQYVSVNGLNPVIRAIAEDEVSRL